MRTLARSILITALAFAAFVFFWTNGRIRPFAEPAADERLWLGAAIGDARMCEAALAQGANVEVRSSTGCTPLIFAAERGDLALAQLLIAAGATVDATSNDDITPLAIAAAQGRVEMMKLLLDSAALIDQPAIAGGTALHAAAAQGQRDAVRLLIARGVNVNARDDHGNTPLMAMLGVGDADKSLAADLIAAGTDLSVTNDEGETADSLAAAPGAFTTIASPPEDAAILPASAVATSHATPLPAGRPR